MEKRDLKYITSERRENDSGVDFYDIFSAENGKRIAIKSNKTTNCFGDFIVGETYTFLLQYGTCYGINYKDEFIFMWAGRIITKRSGIYYEYNIPKSKKPLNTTQAERHHLRFLEKNKISL